MNTIKAEVASGLPTTNNTTNNYIDYFREGLNKSAPDISPECWTN
jgi:hypothetical protein